MKTSLQNIFPFTIGRKAIIISVIPLFYLVFSIIQLNAINKFYLWGPDPVYLFLINGLNLAGGNWELGYLANPGLPVQLFSGIVVFFQHLFTGNGIIYNDVLQNPESYLLTCSVLLILLFVSITYLTGYFLIKRKFSLEEALIFQAAPLLYKQCISLTVTLSSEAFLVITSMIFYALVYFNYKTENKIGRTKSIFILSFFAGFLVVTKITTFPIVILLLFYLKDNRKRLIFLVGTIFSTAILLIPLWNNLAGLFNWINDLLTHQGNYGSGDQGFIDSQIFLINLKRNLTENIVFTFIYVLTSIVFLGNLVLSIKLKIKKFRFFQPANGLLLTYTLFILLVSKQFGFRYLIPAFCLFPLVLMEFKELLTLFFESHLNRKILSQIWHSIIALLFISLLFLQSNNFIKVSRSRMIKSEATHYLENKEVPFILANVIWNGSSFVQSALYNSFFKSGELRDCYLKIMKRNNPNIYFALFKCENITLINWNSKIEFTSVLQKYGCCYLYFINQEEKGILNQLATLYEIQTDCVFDNLTFNERIYKITVSGNTN